MTNFYLNRSNTAIAEAVKAGKCRHCDGVRQTSDEEKICVDCARCAGCGCSPNCVTREPASESDETTPAPAKRSRKS